MHVIHRNLHRVSKLLYYSFNLSALQFDFIIDSFGLNAQACLVPYIILFGLNDRCPGGTRKDWLASRTTVAQVESERATTKRYSKIMQRYFNIYIQVYGVHPWSKAGFTQVKSSSLQMAAGVLEIMYIAVPTPLIQRLKLFTSGHAALNMHLKENMYTRRDTSSP